MKRLYYLVIEAAVKTYFFGGIKLVYKYSLGILDRIRAELVNRSSTRTSEA